eukprot:525193_1
MSGTFGTGLIFYYWPYFDPTTKQDSKDKQRYYNMNDYSGYSSAELFISSAKYTNLKEEALSCGYCPLVLFIQKVIGKANEWIHTEKIKKIKA